MTISYKLKDIRLQEVSIVDVPANGAAEIVLWKRASDSPVGVADKESAVTDSNAWVNQGGSIMSKQDTNTKNHETQAVADLEKRVSEAEVRAKALEKALTDAGFGIKETDNGIQVTKAPEPEYVEIDGEKVEKSRVPAPLLEMIEAQGEEIAELRQKQRDAELARQGAEELPHLGGSDIAKGRLLEAVADDEEMLRALKSADAALAKNMDEVGTTEIEDMGSPAVRLNKMAQDYAERERVPFETAYLRIVQTPEGRELAAKTIRESH